MNLLATLLPSLVKLYSERVKNKHTLTAAVPLAALAAVVTETTPVDPSTLQGLILQVVTAGIALYYFLKKEDKNV